MYIPDYSTARKNEGFTWFADATYYTLMDVANIKMKEFNTNPEAGIEVFSMKYRNAVRELFGEGVRIPRISTPGISYGHLNGLGIDLVFPDGGEVNYVHENKSLDELIKMIKSKKNIDFSKQGMAPFYIDYKNKLEKAYPEERAGFNFGYEGPMTTAYELRDMNVFYDVYDQPQKFKEFLACLTDSIIDYKKFHSQINNQPVFNKNGAGMCDDVASMFPPSMWQEFVLPYWDQYYCGLTDGRREVHCEDLTEAHMHLMEKALLSSYDPGISHKLNPEIIYNNTRVPFCWRMGSFHLKNLDSSEVADWVYKAAADGASCVFIIIMDNMIDSITVEKVKIFVKACRQIENMLKNGATRRNIGEMVSPAGREKFWKHWPR